jgi:hypothetical protein
LYATSGAENAIDQIGAIAGNVAFGSEFLIGDFTDYKVLCVNERANMTIYFKAKVIATFVTSQIGLTPGSVNLGGWSLCV